MGFSRSLHLYTYYLTIKFYFYTGNLNTQLFVKILLSFILMFNIEKGFYWGEKIYRVKNLWKKSLWILYDRNEDVMGNLYSIRRKDMKYNEKNLIRITLLNHNHFFLFYLVIGPLNRFGVTSGLGLGSRQWLIHRNVLPECNRLDRDF